MLSTTTTATPLSPPTSAESLGALIDSAESLSRLRQAHAFLLRRNLHSHPILSFKLLRSYSSLSPHSSLSLSLLRLTPNPTIFFFTSLIHSHPSHALSLYAHMLSLGVEPNGFALSAALKPCELSPGKALHCQAVKLGLSTDLYVGTGLVDVYARGGDVWAARRVFDGMPERSVVSVTAMISCLAKSGRVSEARGVFEGLVEKDGVCWNVMIDGYTQQGMANEALVLFRKMLKARVRVNEVTVLSVLSACGQIGAEELGRWVHGYIESSKIPVNVRVGTALVDMYCKCGSLEDARTVFDSIRDKDVVAWNSMITGYAMHGFSHDAFRLFDELKGVGLRPSDITFIGVLSACAHSGFVKEGREFFASMKDEYGIEPKIEHYGCLVNLLSRAGHLQEAYELVKSMNMEPDPVLWGTLLGACRLHRKTKLGEEIAELLVSRGLANSGTYILLSNIYAANGNWDGVAKMRALMKESGIQKEPGCSSIEVSNKVYEFLAGDKRHPKSREIYAMLEEINGWLKAHGYTPQTDIVLHDLGEREKQQSLEVHSEKLAIAFGLISTKPGTTIKIVKNLRVCSDCHAVIKLISAITGRQIVARDRNRFHHFENGSCSCGDYW